MMVVAFGDGAFDTKWVDVWLRNAGLCQLSASIANSLMYGRM